MHGSYAILAGLPPLAVVTIILCLLEAIPVGRHLLEGLPYDVAYSSFIGEKAMMMGVGLCVAILQRKGVYIPFGLNRESTQSAVAIGSVLAAFAVCLKTLPGRKGEYMDIYHDLIVGSMFLYLGATLLPVAYYNGTKKEWTIIIGILCLCWILFESDKKSGRINQRPWLFHWTGNERFK